MSSVQKRTVHPKGRLNRNACHVDDDCGNDCNNDLFISESFDTTPDVLHVEDQPRLRYETIASRSKNKKLRRDERSMSLRRPVKKLADFDRSLSISLEEILQGINETKSPPAASNGCSMQFASPIASPEQRIDSQFSEYPVDVVFPIQDAQSHQVHADAHLNNDLANLKIFKPQNHANGSCFNDCDPNNNAKFRNAKDDVIRDGREEHLNPFLKTDFQNKPKLPPGHSKIDVPIGCGYVDEYNSQNGSDVGENYARNSSVQHSKRSAVPPNSLQFVAQDNFPTPDNDLSPSSNEVHDILRHASAEYDMSDDEISSCYDTDDENNSDSSSHVTQDVFHEYCTQMSSLTLVPSEDETIVGSYGDESKLKLSRPRCAKEIQRDVLTSGCVTFPGSCDVHHRPVLFIHCGIIEERCGIGRIEITRLMLYLASNASYITLVVSDVSYKSWDIVKDSIMLFQENRSGVLSKIIVLTKMDDLDSSIDQFMAECIIVRKKSDLLDFVKLSSIPKFIGGDMEYNHNEWVNQRLDVESYVLLSERLQHNFASHTLAISTATSPTSAKKTTAALNKHRATMTVLLDDPKVRDLHSKGHNFLKALSKADKPENHLYMEQIQSSYETVCSAIQRYVQCADERLLTLEKQALVKQFEESCDRIVSWASDRQDELYHKFGEVADSLKELRIQRHEFDSFYLEVVKQYAQCDCLLSEANQLSSSGFLGQVNSQARNAAKRISQVVQDMEMKKEEVETASQLFLFVDQAYSWALAGMKFVASLNMKESMTEDELKELIIKYDEYMTSHPMISTEEFVRMQQAAARFQNAKCQRQCEIAQRKCLETRDLFVERRKLIVKARDRQINERRKKEGTRSPDSERDSGICETVSEVGSSKTNTSIEEKLNEKSTKSKSRAILRQSSDVSHRLHRPTTGCNGNNSNGTRTTLQSVNESVVPPVSNKHRPKKMLRKSQSMSMQHSKLKIGAPLRIGEPDTKGRTKWSLAIEELIKTEEEYVKSLNYIIEHYYPLMNQLDDVPQALRGKRGVVFGNIENICDFHSGRFLKALQQCHDQPSKVAEAFIQHRDSFGMYALYSKNKPRSDELMRDHGTIFFRGKQLSLRDKMDLASYLLKPVQRMGKYALLLHNISKHSEVQYRAQLREAEALVKFQLRHGNDLLSMDSIVNCDVNLKEQGELLRQDEFLVFQGRRKFVRHVFLFSDLILFCKPQKIHGGHDVYHYKSSHKTAEVGLTENIGDSGLKFEVWFRRPMQDSIIMHSNSEHKKQAWVDDIRAILWQQAVRNKANRRNEMANMGVGSKPHLDIHSSESPITERSVATERLMSNRVLTSRCRASIAVTSYEHGSKRPHSTVSTSSTSSNGSLQFNALQPASMFDFRAIVEGEEYESGSGQGSSVCMANSEPEVTENLENSEESAPVEALPQQYITTV